MQISQNFFEKILHLLIFTTFPLHLATFPEAVKPPKIAALPSVVSHFAE